MFALTSKCYFLLALIVLTTTISAEECDVIDKTISITCKALENLIKQDDGKLHQQLCSCFTTVAKADLSYCQADGYDFADAPTCGKLFKSKEFKEFSSKNKVDDHKINMLKNVLGMCSEKNEEMIMKSINSMFVPVEGLHSKSLEVVLQTTLPADVGSQVIQCYREVRKLANISV